MSDEPEIRLSPATGAARPAVPPGIGQGQVMVRAGVLEAMDAHVSEDTTVEHGGVMVGGVDAATGTTVVTGSIRAADAVSAVASLTFTHATWDHINAAMERDFPDQRIVGWYHSHPHFGIFLSEHDQFIHKNFFSQPWQIAYVRDPLLDQRGFFAWVDGQLVEIDRWQTGGAAPVDVTLPTPPRPPSAKRRRGPIVAVLVVLALLAAGVVALKSQAGDSGGAVAIDLALGARSDRKGAPGTTISVGRVTVQSDGGGVLVVEATPAAGQHGEVAVEVVPPPASAGRQGSYLLLADPAIGTEDGTYEGAVTAKMCPSADHCGAEAPTSTPQSFQVTVGSAQGVAVPRRNRWVDAPEAGLVMLPDEVLVYGQASATDKVDALGAPGAQLLGQRPTGVDNQTLSQVGWPADALPPDLAPVTNADDVDRHYGFPAPDHGTLATLESATVKETIGINGQSTPSNDPVSVVTLSGARGAQRTVCQRAATNRCGGGGHPGGFPRGTGPAHRVSILEMGAAMDAAAQDADVVFVGWDLPQCGGVGPTATGAVADMWDVLSQPIQAHPETLWVLSADAQANARCPDGTKTLALQLDEFDNAISVSGEASVNAEVTGPYAQTQDSPSIADDIEAGAVVASAAAELWPGGAGAADAIAACLDKADNGGPLDLSDGC